jgi:hypothetical protein
MESQIQTHIDAVAAALDHVLSDDELTPYLQLLVLEAIARAIDEYIERISDQMASEQAQ